MKMKKMYFKKFMSVFMAVLMLLSCWVWIAPEKASAAAGNYYIRIDWSCSSGNFDNDVAFDQDNGGSCIGILVDWTSDNGKGATTGQKVFDLKGEVSNSSTTTTYSSDTIGGFPTKVYVILDDDRAAVFGGDTVFEVKKIQIGPNSSNLTTIWEGVISLESTNQYKYLTLDLNGTVENSSNASISTTTDYWDYPYADDITWSPDPLVGMQCPTGSATETQDVSAVAYDQYGVEMFDPTWSVKGSVCGTNGISVDPATSSKETTIKLTNAANNTTATDTQTGTLVATWDGAGTDVTDNRTFTITDSYYTATFNYKTSDGADTSATRNGYHGDTITAPSTPSYYDGDYLKTFSAWSPAFSSTITKDITYNATYSQTFVEADYTAVNEAIAAADAIKAQYGTDYEFKYTHASRTALDAAINAVVRGLGRTQQDVVDGYAKVINDAIAALEPNVFDVIFLNKDGAILLYDKGVEYKESVTAPADPEDYYDSANHYSFTGWDTTEYLSVVDDLVINPVYSAQAHEYQTETVPSSCVQAGATKYTCTVCGYSYISDETSLGDHAWENDYTTDLEPTCTLAGSKSIHCSLCDATKDITEIPAAGHIWASQSIAVSPTCTNIGIATRVCDECGVCEHSVIDALTHDYVETVVDPTCTAKGYTEHVCQRTDCGFSYRDTYTDVAAHSFGDWETVSAAACEVAGSEKRTCEDCGFMELQSTEALTHNVPSDWTVVVEATCEGKGYRTKTCTLCGVVQESEVIPATGHSNTTETKAATCTEAGYTKVICSACGKTETTIEQPLGHSYDSGVHSDATCTNGGFTTYTCGTCGHSYIVHDEGSTGTGHDFTGIETVVAEATCTADGEKTVQCANDGCEVTITVVIPKTGHTWDAEWTTTAEATCTADGEKVKECASCDETQTVVIPKTGHTWGEWTVTKEATNTEDGSMTRECENGCTETVAIPKGGHVWDNGTVTKEPSCTETGTKVYKCTEHTSCGVELEITLDMIQHTAATETLAATCTAEGYVRTYCSVCNKEFSNETTAKAAHNHAAGEAVEPTCTTSGYTPYTCACGDTYNVYDVAKPATGHSYVEGASTATCTAEGMMTLDCENCDNSITVTVPALGHNYVKDSTASTEATCADAATDTYKCSRCADSYTVPVGDKSTSHTWGGWQVKQSATANSIGYRTNTCTVCGKVEVETIQATGEHVLDNETDRQAATCTADGWIEYACSAHTDCGVTDRVTIPAAGHTEKLEYTAATCEAEGSTKMVCSVEGCKAVLEEEKLPALGHVWTEETVTNATCSATGKIEYTCTREGCDATHEVELPRNYVSHDYVTTITVATCEKEGSIVVECTRCPSNPVNEPIAKLEHTWNDTPDSSTPATCEKDGSETYKCQKCDSTKEVTLSKTGHTWGEWEVTTPSTNTAEGKMTRTCEKGCEETVAIPAGGHNLVESAKTDATCAAEGSVTYDCDAHTGDKDCGITVTVALEKTQHALTINETPADCENPGSVVVSCENCSTVSKTTVIPATGHTYDDGEKTDATCTAEGKIVYRCSANGCTSTKEVVLEKLQHNYEAGTAVAATCTSSGYTPYKCANCDSSYVIITANANGHDFAEGTSTATCIAAGEMTLECKNCDETMTVDVPALGHDYELVSTTDATCLDAATETYDCSRCDEAYTAITAAANGHSFGEWTTVQEATTDKYGTEKRTCSCGAEEYRMTQPIGDHVFESTVVKNASCTEDGSEEFVCTKHENCSANYTAALPATGHKQALRYTAATCEADGSAVMYCETCDAELKNETIPALDHVWGNEQITLSTCSEKGKVEFTCTRCSKATKTVDIDENPDAHSLTTTTTPATCTKDGSAVTSCTLCGSKLVETALAMTGHNWGDWEVTKAATNTADGEMTRYCQNNGCTEKETVAIPMGGHKFDTVPSAITPASCTQEGSATYNCTAHNSCGVTITVTLAKTQHTLKTDSKNASCTETGYVKTYCSACDEVYTNMTLGKLAHEFEATVTVDPTCIQSGYTTYKCKNCDESYNEIGVNANGHDYKEVEGSSTATCTTAGEMTLKCACGAEMKAPVPALGHVYEAGTVFAPTCLTSGYTEYVCKNDASHTYNVYDAAKPATGHAWGDWEIITNATETTDGLKERACDCGAKEEEVIPAMKHNMTQSEYVAPTCSAEGKIVYKCSVDHEGVICSHTLTVTLPKTAHTLTTAVEKATCETAGSVVTSCTECDGVNETTVLSPLGHKYKGEVTTEPTCTEDGEMTYTCENDAKHTYKEAIAATGHDYEPVLTAPTCTKQGFTTYTCSCGDIYVTNYVDALGHSFGDWTDGGDGEVHTRSCQRNDCDAHETQNHKWDNGEITTAPTYDTPGVKTYTCLICAATKTETVDIAIDVTAPSGKIKWDAAAWDSFLNIISFGTFVNYDVKLEIEAADAESGVKSIEYYISDTALTIDEVTATADWTAYDEENKLTISAVDAARFVVYAKITDNSGNVTYISTDGFTFDTAEPILSISAEYGNTATNEYCSEVTVHIEEDNLKEVYLNGAPVLVSGNAYSTDEIGTHTLTVVDMAGNSAEATFTINGGHTAVVVNGKEATCTEAGLTEGRYCSVCNEVLLEQTVAAALGHDLSTCVETKAPTCTEKGEEEAECSRCGHYVTREVLAKGHSYEKVVTAPTCTEGGYTTYTCYGCGNSYKANYTDATGHSMGAWVTTTEQTCTKQGEKRSDCENCDYYETRTIPADGHKWSRWEVVEGECSVGVTRERKCSVCGEVETETLEKGEHTYMRDANGDILYDDIVAPNCIQDGYRIYSCTVCKKQVTVTAADDETLKAYGHKWVVSDETDSEGWIVSNAPTCFRDGSKYRTCANGCMTECGLDINSREIAVIPATNHKGSWVAQPGRAATCLENGYTDYYLCMACGFENGKNTVPATGHSDSDNDGTCETCNKNIHTAVKCDCLCHNDNAIMKIIYRILRFFWTLFKTNQACECGAEHY